MAFPTIRMQPPVDDPCPHSFPYATDGGHVDIRPCEKCGTPWENRNDDYPNSCVIWSLPKDMVFGMPLAPDTFLPAVDPEDMEADPGWFNWG